MFGLVLANLSLVVFELPQEGQGFPGALAGEAKAASSSLMGVSYGFIYFYRTLDVRPPARLKGC